LKPAGGKCQQAAQGVQVHTVPVPLVSQGGIGIPIAEDNGALQQGGANPFLHKLGTGCQEEQDFGAGMHGAVFRAVQKHIPHLVADDRPARFPRGQNGIPLLT